MAAYVVGRRGTTREVVAIGLTVAATHGRGAGAGKRDLAVAGRGAGPGAVAHGGQRRAAGRLRPRAALPAGGPRPHRPQPPAPAWPAGVPDHSHHDRARPSPRSRPPPRARPRSPSRSRASPPPARRRAAAAQGVAGADGRGRRARPDAFRLVVLLGGRAAPHVVRGRPRGALRARDGGRAHGCRPAARACSAGWSGAGTNVPAPRWPCATSPRSPPSSWWAAGSRSSCAGPNSGARATPMSPFPQIAPCDRRTVTPRFVQQK